MSDNHLLWSEATNSLDFGAGTKVRIKNTTVVLKGKFLRDDNHAFKAVAINEAAIQRAHNLLTQTGIPHDPWVGQEAAEQETRLSRRIIELRNRLEHANCSRLAALDKVSAAENAIRQLKDCFKELRNKFVEIAKNNFVDTIDKIMEAGYIE